MLRELKLTPKLLTRGNDTPRAGSYLFHRHRTSPPTLKDVHSEILRGDQRHLRAAVFAAKTEV